MRLFAGSAHKTIKGDKDILPHGRIALKYDSYEGSKQWQNVSIPSRVPAQKAFRKSGGTFRA